MDAKWSTFCDSDIVSVAKIVASFRSQIDLFAGDLELEVRVGQMENGRFVPGVPSQKFEEMEKKLLSNSELKNSDWKEHSDFFWNSQSGPVRSRVEYDVDTLEVAVTHSRKEVICKQDVLLCDGVTARVSFSKEHPVIVDDINFCTPWLVRIQQRKQVLWGRENVSWRYELSRTWSAPTRTDVEIARNSQESQNEVEIEVEPVYVRSRSDEFVAESILLKAAQLYFQKL